ncbi:hypothetical protein C8Q80DRAFT_1270792 [Daedaleopsis nitida]|nr:hypothetical protein C8Q80DRAFT_1270792 [Daedaleopsis nitida]
MKFLFAPIAFAATALAAPSLESRQTGWCAVGRKTLAYGYTEQFAYDLAIACMNNTTVTDSGALWSNKVCVAAAAASVQFIGPDIVAGAASCQNSTVITSEQAVPNLDYNVYAGIVGDCAWAPGGCPITQQNFIDLVYSALTELGKGNWPSSPNVILTQGWQKLLDWTKTGETVPYTNFNDFLHYYHV